MTHLTDISKMKTKKLLITILLALPFCMRTLGCTLMIVAASATEDGRPILFKNRDSSNAYMVDMRIDQQEGFRFIGQYALREGTWEGPWSGYNETGFCIANSLSYNYSGAEYASMNKDILDMALRHCETAVEFEQLIDRLEKPVDVRANYAVIDAQGNAAFYEVGPYGYTKYDANDPQTAPEGVLIRTNYSLAGDLDRKVGEDRWKAAEIFVSEAMASQQFNWRYILQNLPRFLVHSNGTDLYADAPATWNDERQTDFDGYIPRHSSTNAVLMQGVKAGESPLLTVLWSISGPPVSTVALPLLFTANNILPEKTVMTDNRSWLCEKGQSLKAIIFPYQENATKLIDLSKLYNREETGIMQRIVRIEGEIIERGYRVIENARLSGKISEDSLADYYAWLDKYIGQEYGSEFDDMITGIQNHSLRNRQHFGCWDISGKRQSNPLSYRGIVIRNKQKYLNY